MYSKLLYKKLLDKVLERDSDALAEGLLELLAALKTLAYLSRAAHTKNDALDKQLVELTSALALGRYAPPAGACDFSGYRLGKAGLYGIKCFTSRG